MITLTTLNLLKAEREIMITALANSQTLNEAAGKLGISRHRMRRKIQAHDLELFWDTRRASLGDPKARYRMAQREAKRNQS